MARDPTWDVSALAEKLNEALAHRGPDGSGLHFARGRSVALGHRRLSILDLEGGHQPMSNEDGQIWLVFNGEIYNHPELRSELTALGHRFVTRSDTEVVVHGWEAWGQRVLERLNGMYAFALYDGRPEARGGEIWLARDPAGIKPLYVGHEGGRWWFASELAAARRCGLLDSSLRPEAFDEYLVYRFVPSPGTFYRSVWKLPPSHACCLRLDALPTEPVFERFAPGFKPASIPTDARGWQEAIRSHLRSAVRRQLSADVSVGTLLSGGVDSTLVTRFMKDDLAEPPRAFAVGFAEAPGGGELGAACRAGSALGVPVTEVEVSEEEYLAAWPSQIAALGEPIANPGMLLVGLLCQAVRKSHKVVLTGQGADEPLGGYARHAAERLYGVARLMRPILTRLPESIAASDRLARLRRAGSEPDEARRFAEILAVFGPREAVALGGHDLDPDGLVDPVRRWLPDDGNRDSLNRLLQVDSHLSLADDLLVVADHTSMAASVELRVPFLDLAFLALVDEMPSRYKVSPFGERKWLYRRAVAPLLPAALRSGLVGWRARLGRKLGFATPVDSWLGRWIATEADDYLLGPRAFSPQFLRRDKLRDVLENARVRPRARARQLSSLYVLECWLRGALGQ